MAKILLVEDDKSLREIYGVRLLAEGYDIVSAGDGEEALAMAIKDRPDLIVSDVMMPKISGFDMLDILRSTTETKDIKVIMMTALSSEEQRQRGVALGADRYLVKSQVGIEDVVRTVHEVLADAPITGQTPLVSRPVVASTPTPSIPTPTVSPPAAPGPIAGPGPGAVASAPLPSPTVAPTPAFVTPVTAPPAPAAPPVTPAPMPASPPPMAPTTSPLPQPTAPFSTPRPGTLADRVIQPLGTVSETTPDFGHLMNQELSTQPAAPAPIAAPAPSPLPQPMSPPSSSPATAAPSGLDFEETPRPAAPAAPSLTVPPLPPLPPPPPGAAV